MSGRITRLFYQSKRSNLKRTYTFGSNDINSLGLIDHYKLLKTFLMMTVNPIESCSTDRIVFVFLTPFVL